MGRRASKAIHRATTDNGIEFGVHITEQDRERLMKLIRWYTLSAEHIARSELPVEDWFPAPIGPGNRELYDSKVLAVKRRFAKLARIEEVGVMMGPLLEGRMFAAWKSTYYLTRYGMTHSGAPWAVKPNINPAYVAHAWVAADVGMQLEREGFTVYSEREASTLTTYRGEEITTPIESWHIAPNGTKTSKKPDLVIPSPDRRTFIAVEIENDRNRALSVYKDKLKAYDNNPAMKGVWYLCDNQTTYERVEAAAIDLFGDRPFPLRLRVLSHQPGFGIENFRDDRGLLDDLRGLYEAVPVA